MASDQGWLVRLPVVVADDDRLAAGMTYIVASGHDLAAACADLGIDSVLFALDPATAARAVVFSFEPDVVPETAAADVGGLCTEALGRLQFHELVPPVRIAGQGTADWHRNDGA